TVPHGDERVCELVQENGREEQQRRDEGGVKTDHWRPVRVPAREDRDQVPGQQYEDEYPAPVDGKLDAEDAPDFESGSHDLWAIEQRTCHAGCTRIARSWKAGPQ